MRFFRLLDLKLHSLPISGHSLHHLVLCLCLCLSVSVCLSVSLSLSLSLPLSPPFCVDVDATQSVR